MNWVIEAFLRYNFNRTGPLAEALATEPVAAELKVVERLIACLLSKKDGYD